MIQSGKYKHFKGGLYEVVCTATHTETLEDMVVYKDNKEKTWVRPEAMWNEIVDTPCGKVQRFTKIESEDKQMVKVGDIVKPSVMNLESLGQPVKYIITEVNSRDIRGLWKDDDGWHVNESIYDNKIDEEMEDFTYYYDVVGHITESELNMAISECSGVIDVQIVIDVPKALNESGEEQKEVMKNDI